MILPLLILAPQPCARLGCGRLVQWSDALEDAHELGEDGRHYPVVVHADIRVCEATS